MRPPLRFRDDQTFTIVQFTDVHWRNGEEADRRTEALMERVLTQVQPDLAVITGDVIDSSHCRDPLASFGQAVGALDRSGIPWAFVFGNHDSEGEVSREALMSIATSHANCMAEPGPAELSGVGNYFLDIASSDGSDERSAQLVFLDSGDYAAAPVGGYAWIRRDQIGWYAEQSSRRKYGRSTPLPSLAFFHIPLHEYKEVWERGDCTGVKLEDVCASGLNSGFFSAMVEQGDILGTFVGHDHINDYIGELHGIRLAYGRATGYNTYGKDGYPRGARVIRLLEGENRFDTWVVLEE